MILSYDIVAYATIDRIIGKTSHYPINKFDLSNWFCVGILHIHSDVVAVIIFKKIEYIYASDYNKTESANDLCCSEPQCPLVVAVSKSNFINFCPTANAWLSSSGLYAEVHCAHSLKQSIVYVFLKYISFHLDKKWNLKKKQ